MRLYLAGPLFTEADRRFVDDIAEVLDAAGHECFVPHRQPLDDLTPTTIHRVDGAGVLGAEVLVAWLDGNGIDDGTACEIGMFAECCRREPARYRGIVGLATDWRTLRRREAGTVGHGLNLFVVGTIEAYGTIVFDLADLAPAVDGLA